MTAANAATDALHAHLKTGVTTVARAWVIERKDGTVLGFTDHDMDLVVDGYDCTAQTGMTAKALIQTTGLAVDNTEAQGALSDARITEADINAGLYDHAAVKTWLVNWRNVADAKLTFQGTLGEIRRNGGAFEVELRGLTEDLNTQQGRVYQKTCPHVMGDAGCRVDMTDPAHHLRAALLGIEDRKRLRLAHDGTFPEGWFLRGKLVVESGAGQHYVSWIASDTVEDGVRVLETWEPIRADLQAGDVVLVWAGCDGRLSTCRDRFHNVVNFGGFPHIPGEDWMMSVPVRSGDNSGGSLS